MTWWIDEILDEIYRNRKRPVNANDIPKINGALEEASSLIKRGWTQWAGFGSGGIGARTKNDHNIDDLDDDATLDQVNWDDPRAVCWCLEGALLLAAKKKGLTEELTKTLFRRVAISIMEADPDYGEAMDGMLIEKHEVGSPEYFVVSELAREWNDMDRRIKEEVLTILKASQIQGGADEG